MGQSSYSDVTTCFYPFSDIPKSLEIFNILVVIDSATYLLTISSPDINKVAMSLYDIITVIIFKASRDVVYSAMLSASCILVTFTSLSLALGVQLLTSFL